MCVCLDVSPDPQGSLCCPVFRCVHPDHCGPHDYVLNVFCLLVRPPPVYGFSAFMGHAVIFVTPGHGVWCVYGLGGLRVFLMIPTECVSTMTCVFLSVCVFERVCVCVCVCVRERVCVSVSV